MTEPRKRRRRTVRDEERAAHGEARPEHGEAHAEAAPEQGPEGRVEGREEAASASPPATDTRAADEAQARVLELEDKLKRALADFRNETQRIARQAEEGRKYAVEGLVKELLPVFDALHSARQGLVAAGGEPSSASAGVDAVRQGLDLVERELLNVLRRHGVQRIEADAEPFDPGLHEALLVVDHPELEPGVVAQVLRPGFTLHGRVVRPAHVAVTRAAAPADEADDAADSAETED